MTQQTGQTKPSASPMRAASAINTHFDTRTAATELAFTLHDQLDGPCDLLFLFASYHHRAALEPAGEIIRQAMNPAVLLGATAESVLGDDEEIEGRCAMSAIALTLPGVRLTPIRFYRENFHEVTRSPEAMRAALGADDPDFRAAIVLADPFTTPMQQIMPMLTAAGSERRPAPILGGLASGASKPGLNVLLLDDQATPEGLVGVSIAGEVEVDAVVSQGYRPIGRPLVITKSRDNVVLELGGRKALEVVQEMAQGLTEHERTLLGKGLFVGLAISAAKDRFGRNDFLIRGVLGFDQRVGGMAVGDMIRTGQTIQFHVRDAETADEDLQLLLDAQQLRDPPFAGLLFTCSGRGTKLFDEPNHDAALVRNRLNHLPLAGFFAAGELGPIGGTSFLHGHTASLALFRRRSGSDPGDGPESNPGA